MPMKMKKIFFMQRNKEFRNTFFTVGGRYTEKYFSTFYTYRYFT